MKITFVQSDISAALRAHIVSQGITLEGKSVDIKFTQRKGNLGVEADVTIEATPRLPDLADPVKPTLSVVTSTPVAIAAAAPAVTVEAIVEPAEPSIEQATGTDDAAVAAPAAKTTSLFN